MVNKKGCCSLPRAVRLGSALLLALSASAAFAAGGYEYDAAHGKTVYENTCEACHQANGAGVPGAFPALKGNSAVNADDPTLQIHTALFGAQGRVIDGVDYSNTAMPGFGSNLSDVDAADLINYERESWGNHGKPITPEQVKAVRAKGP